MNMKFKQILISAVVTLMVFSSGAAYAWPAYGQGQEKDGKRAWEKMEEKREKFIKELGLTPEQEEQIKNLRKEKKEKRGELWIKIQAQRLELKEELEKPTTDRARIDSIIAELNVLMAEKLEQRVEGILSMKETLTPEQYEKFKNKIEECKDKARHDGKEKKRGRGFKR